jgi:hypothetical protein
MEGLLWLIGQNKYIEFAPPKASVIRLNPAIRDQVKSGHREWPKT